MKQSFSIFRVHKMRFFVKDLPNICCKIVPNQFSKILGHMHNWQNGWVQKVLIHLSWKRQISADSVGNGSNLNWSCLIVCYLFFSKNKEETTRQPHFKFDPLPTESAEICLFHQRRIKTFYTQPFGQLCIKYVLVF